MMINGHRKDTHPMKTRPQTLLMALLLGLGARLMADEPAKNPGLSFISVGNSHANLLRLLDPLAKWQDIRSIETMKSTSLAPH